MRRRRQKQKSLKTDIRLGARLGFSNLAELENIISEVDFSVELALPHLTSDFARVADRIPDIRDTVKAAGIEVLSVHAPQGDLAAEDYRTWAEPTLWLAKQLGAKSVTLHPPNARKQRTIHQATFMRHLRELQQKSRIVIAVETFLGKRRVLHPNEVVGLNIPMVLDTSHIHDQEYILTLLREYCQNIPTVHLSSWNEKEQHLPIDRFCLRVVRLLARSSWCGSIILEYLPWHRYRVKDDLLLLRKFLAGEQVTVLPRDDRYRHDPSRWRFA